jgi:hypothetical protein
MKGEHGEPLIAVTPECIHTGNASEFMIVTSDYPVTRRLDDLPLKIKSRLVACINALDGYNPDAVREVIEAGEAVLKTRKTGYWEFYFSRSTKAQDMRTKHDEAIDRLCAALDKVEGA